MQERVPHFFAFAFALAYVVCCCCCLRKRKPAHSSFTQALPICSTFPRGCMAINQTQSVRLSPSRSYPQATSSKGPSATKRKLVALAYAVLIQDDGQVLTGLVELLLVKTYDSRYYGSLFVRIEHVPLRDGIN
jgi:hypothetical protein